MSSQPVSSTFDRANALVIVQLAFWGPHREVVADLAAVRRQRRAEKLTAAAQFIAAVVFALVGTSAPGADNLESEGVFPCTWPGCSRGPLHPFETAARLANHRFAAHGVRTTNEDSIRRQERRDRQRAAAAGVAAPEYIDGAKIRDAVKTRFPISLPPGTRDGALDPGERELLRRRLCHLVTTLPREIRREPAEIALAATELLAGGLTPTGPKLIDPRNEDTTLERLSSLWSKTTQVRAES